MLSLDFCNYAVEENLISNGAVVICQAPVNKDYEVSFGSFDYEVPSGIGVIKNILRKKI